MQPHVWVCVCEYTRVTDYVFPFMNIWTSPGTYRPSYL